MIVIYSKKGCAKCVQAENLCRIRQVEHTVKKLEKDYTLEELQKLTGIRPREMPVVLLDGTTVTNLEGLATFLKK